MPTGTAVDSVARARGMAPVFRLNAAASEEARALTPEVHQSLIDSGVYSMLAPRAFGGEECDLLTFGRVIREIARADGSAGWCAMISGVYATFAGLMPPTGAAEVFASTPAVIAGSLAPAGQAVIEGDGYRVSGRWSFGSNAAHANWFCGGCIVVENGAPVMEAPGVPKLIVALFPAGAVTIIDTWTSTGLRGTGSQDYSVDGVVVPGARTFWFTDPPVADGPLYALPSIAAFATVIANVTVGIAQHMLDLFVALAPAKYPVLSPLSLQQKANVHDRVGVAVAEIDASIAYLERVVTDAWDVVERGGTLDWHQRGRLWLGATHAAHTAQRASESLYAVAGASAVYATGELDRCLRDARTGVQHVTTQFINYEIAGKQALGLDVRDSLWAFDYRRDAGE